MGYFVAGLGWRFGLYSEQLPRRHQAGLASAIGQQPIVPDSVEAARQHVQ